MSINISNRYSKYQNQTVSWESFKEYDSYGKPTYNTAVNISAREVKKTKLVKDTLGTQRVSTNAYMVSSDVGLQDKINSKLILSLENAVDAKGTECGKLVYI